jgi:hypothetical protein
MSQDIDDTLKPRRAARERHLGRAFAAVAALHNRLGLTGPLDTRTRPYFDRPYQVIGAGRFAAALRAAITDPQIRALPLAGAVDQVIDSTDAIGSSEIRRAAIAAVTGSSGPVTAAGQPS